MKANQLATLALRLIGIYILVEFVPVIPVSLMFAPFLQENLNTYEIIMTAVVVLSVTAQFIVGILLIVKSVPWGEKLMPQNSTEINVTSISFEQVQVLAFAAVGALIFAGALSQLFNSIYSASIALTHFNKEQYPAGTQIYDWRSLLTAFGVLLKTALGLWMFFGARGFANFWRSLRNFGTPKPPEN
jgi:hypothetical protein